MNLLATLCMEMPDMVQCAAYNRLCAVAASTYGVLCGSNTTSGETLPPMKMWLHTGITDILLIKSWVPQNDAQYAASCIAVIATAVLVQGLKALRVMCEANWAAKGRARDAGCVSECAGAKCDFESGLEAGGSQQEEGSTLPGSSRLWRHRSKWWQWMGDGLPGRAQFGRNAVRAAFTGVIVFLDYMLMLIVMSFNIGIILSAVAGFALGALIFGHLGERVGGATVVAVGDVAPDSENDLEVRFVEAQTCHSSSHV
jgi:hypothetical protein